ncbi:zinc finger protein 718-like [Hyperolius riggenbachi]|uniref:zinc finger protein 718-like n=1 Tax=Hyperolius riggenbachi TaxID=752182 RepID=UPI0035A38344
MPKCIYRSCPHFMGKKCCSPGITLHIFPKDLGRVRLWLQQTGQYYDNLEALAEKISTSKNICSYRMCSAHFLPECYISQGGEMLLRPDAVPTVFPGNIVTVAMEWNHMPSKKAQRLVEKNAGRRYRWAYVDAATCTGHISQTEMGTQTDLTMVTTPSRTASTPHWLSNDRGVQWPEYEFNFYGEDWKVQLDHMYYNSRFKCVTDVPNVDQQEFPKNSSQAPPTQQSLSQDDYDDTPQAPPSPEPQNYSETPEGYFFSKCSLRNKRTLWILQARMVALLRHMTEAPHMGTYKRQRTRKLLSQIVEVVCLMEGEDLKLIKQNENLKKFYQKEGEIPLRYQDVAVFFTRDEWGYIEDHEDLYKKDVFSDPSESKEDQLEDILDTFEEDTEITDDHFFKLVKENPPGLTQGSVPMGRKRTKDLPYRVLCIPENIHEGDGHEDSDGDNAGLRSRELFSDNDDAADEEERWNRLLDLDIANEETVRDSQDVCLPIKREDDFTAEVSIDCKTTGASRDIPSPTLWIAEDGTTSTQWVPQHNNSSASPILKRPRGRRKKSKEPELPKMPNVASDTGGLTANAAPGNTERAGHSKSFLQGPTVLDYSPGQSASFWCDTCSKCFPSEKELEKHRVTHHEVKPLKCEDCIEIFDSKSALAKHRANKHGKLRYPCDTCGLQYNYRSQYIIHQRTHTGEKPFCCKECGQAFGHKCSLLLHMKKHSGSSLFKCGRCEKQMDNEQALEKHRKLRFCVCCKKCFTRRAMRRHLKSHLPEELAKNASA